MFGCCTDERDVPGPHTWTKPPSGSRFSSFPFFLCQVSLRKQEIADRLNAWIIFNEKNKELCEWLTHMENKVAHNSDLNIEEMVEKLKKVG